jgi:RHS repeat-associated protein
MPEASYTNNLLMSAGFTVTLGPAPALAVSDVQAPAQDFSGQTMNVSWTVSNNGTGPADGSTDTVYMSPAATAGSGDTLLGTFRHEGALAPGDSYSSNSQVQLPVGVSGPYYILVQTACQYGSTVTTSVAATTAPVNVNLTPPPDLTASLTSVPGTALASHALTFSYQVANSGAGATPNYGWTDAYYLSPTALFNPSTAVLLGQQVHGGSLAPGASYASTVTETLPNGLSGTFFLFVQADSGGAVFELPSYTPNKLSAPAAIQIASQPADLVVSAASAPPTAASGTDVTVNWTATNQGTGDTAVASWTDSVYVDAGATLDASAVLLGSFTHSGLLTVGGSYSQSQAVLLPQGLAGNYNLFVVTNANHAVFEGANSGNDTSAPLPIAIELPDLVVSAASAPPSALSGSAVRVNWTVTNQGTARTAATSWQDYVYADTGTILDSNAVLLGSFTHNGALAAGGSYSQSQLVTMPISLSGAYNLLVVTNEPGGTQTTRPVVESNTANDLSAPLPIALAQQLADLQVASVTAPSSASTGSRVTVNWTVQNDGAAATNSNYWYDDVWLSTNTTLASGGTDVYLGTFQHTNPLAAGGSYSASLTVTLPQTLAGGSDYLIVATDRPVAPPNDSQGLNLVIESNENNNETAAATTINLSAVPNLTVTNVTAPLTGTAGQVLPLSWTVTNSGAGTGNTPITDSVYLAYGTLFDPTSERYVGSLAYSGGLASGASYTQSDDLQLPAGVAGTFYVFVETNSNGAVYERNAPVSAAATAEPVQIGLMQPADLVAGAVTIPANSVVGQNFTISYQVTNQSSGQADGTWYDSLYLSPTPAWAVSDPLLGQVKQTQNLAPGGSYTGTLTVPLPGVTPGTYYVVLRTNILNNFPELTQSNNLSVSLTQSSVAAQSLTLGTAAAGTLADAQSAFYQVAVDAGQTLQINFNSQQPASLNELYVSFAQMPTRGQYDYRFPSLAANQQITVPTTQSGTYYILAYGSSVSSTPENYTLTAMLVPFVVTAVEPGQIGTGQATIEIDGSKFDSNTTFQLLGPSGTTVPDTAVYLQDASTAFATFNLTGMPLGTYAVRATQSGGTTTKLAAALAVVVASAQTGPQIYLSVPASVLPGGEGEATVDYANPGNTDIVAPFLELTASNALLRLETQDAFTGDSVQFLGISSSGPAGILRPGESGSINVPFAATGDAGQDVDFSLGIGDDSQPMDWAAQESALCPAWIPAAAWPGVFANFVANVGGTMASYHAVLAADATYLSQFGEVVYDPSQLVSFEIEKADAAYTGQTLTTVVDDSLPAPGLALTFQRSFQESIGGRYYQGMLGYGWATNWDISISTDANGNPTLSDCGVELFYALQSDGSYQDEPGDYSTLTLTNGAYRLTEPDGTFYQFNANGRLDYVQDSHGNQIACGYNIAGQLVLLTDSNGEFLALSYNPQGDLALLTDSSGQSETYGYDPSGQFLTSVTAASDTTTYSYVTGQSPQQDNALAEIAYADNTHVFFSYDSQGRLIDQHQDGGAQDQSYAYLTPGGYTLTDGDHNTTTVLFDQFGDTVETIDPLGNVTHYQYDSNTDLTSVVGPGGTTYAYTYDANGNPTSETDPLGNTTKFSYDASDNLTSFTDANGNTTSYAYNSANDLLSTAYANGTTQSSTYNPLGEATQFVEANGQATAMQYNADGLVTQETFADGSSYTYTYDARGNLFTATDAGGTITFSYTDPSNPDLLTEVQYADGTFLKFSYNSVGQRTQSVDQTGYRVNYTYDAVGRLSELTDGSGNLIVQYTYDAAGNLVQKDNGNGTRTVYTYNGDGEVLTITNLAPDHQTVDSFDTYTYDALGNVLTDTNQDGQWVYSYDADSQLTQAVFTPNSTDPDGLSAENLQYVYDVDGNRLGETVNGVVTTYAVNNMDQYTSSTTAEVGTTTYHYDADGNLIAQIAPGGTTSYTFNQLDQLTAISGPGLSASYVYDPLLNRIAETINGATTNFQIDPVALGNVVATYSTVGGPVTHYTYGLGLVSQVSSTGVAACYDFNNIGSTVGITNAAGKVINSYAYDPFGNSLAKSETVLNPFQFVGEYGVTTEGNGLDFMRARFYDLNAGRFVQQDPLGIAAGLNFYAYVGNNSLSLTDPSGYYDNGDNGGGITRGGRLTGDPDPNKIGPLPERDPIIAKINKGAQKKYRHKRINHPPVKPPPVAPTKHGPKAKTDKKKPSDPNNLIGPAGFGDPNFVSVDQSLPYTIDFENEPTAGPAQQVTITQQLDANLNWQSFRLGSFGFGGQSYQVPADRAYYQTQIDLTQSTGYYVDVTATIDERTGIATWIFTTIDPATGQVPLDPGIGFLPPDNSSGAGEGFVSYTVQAGPADPTGTVINAQATVTFDTQPPMNTAQVSNTIDAGTGLGSAVAALPGYGTAPDFLVSWSGSDAENGSAIASFTIYVSDNDGPYTAWLQGTTLTSATFSGQYYHTYRFYSLATDNVGNVEAAKATVDASTTVIPAGTAVWSGGGTDSLWSTAANWATAAAPATGEDLAFFGAVQTATDNDLAAGTSLDSLNLVSPGFVLAGNGVTLASQSGPVVNLAATSGTIQLPITLGSNATFAVTDVPGSLTVSGDIDNAGYGLTVDTGSSQSSTLSGSISGVGGLIKSGAGKVVLSGSNSFSGGTTVTAGTLVVALAGSLPDGSNLTVGSGSAFGDAQGAPAAPDISVATTGSGPVLASPSTPSGPQSGDPVLPAVVPGNQVTTAVASADDLWRQAANPSYRAPGNNVTAAASREQAHDAVLQSLNTRPSVAADQAAAFWDLDDGQSKRKQDSMESAVDAVMAMLERV